MVGWWSVRFSFTKLTPPQLVVEPLATLQGQRHQQSKGPERLDRCDHANTTVVVNHLSRSRQFPAIELAFG